MTLRGSVLLLAAMLAGAAGTRSHGVPPSPELARPDAHARSGFHAAHFASSFADERLAPVLGPLPFYYDLYTFRGTDGGTEVVASFAVPARGLESERVDGDVRYRFDVRFVLTDPEHRAVYRTDDSVFVHQPWALDGDHLLHTYVSVEAPPSRNTLQRVVMTDATRPGVGQLYRSSFVVPDYRGDDLMLSDVALGLPGAEEGWRRGDVTLALLPTGRFPESSFDVYYEIYNLPVGAPYETEITIEPLGSPSGDDGQPVRIRFSGEAEPDMQGYVAELRHVASALPEGRYRMTVAVTEEVSGRTAMRARSFEVQPWESGTTIVAAHSRRRVGH